MIYDFLPSLSRLSIIELILACVTKRTDCLSTATANEDVWILPIPNDWNVWLTRCLCITTLEKDTLKCKFWISALFFESFSCYMLQATSWCYNVHTGWQFGATNYKTVLQGSATRWCYKVVLQDGATRWCYKVVLQGGATRWCYKVVLKGGTTRRYKLVLQGGATSWCYKVVLQGLTASPQLSCWSRHTRVSQPRLSFSMILLLSKTNRNSSWRLSKKLVLELS